MATNKQKSDPMSGIKGSVHAIPWVAFFLNVVAAGAALFVHYSAETDEAFMAPYTHMHYMDPDGKYICGDQYIDKKHVCDGRFLLVKAERPTLEDFLKLGLTKDQWDTTQKTLEKFKCEGPNEEQGT